MKRRGQNKPRRKVCSENRNLKSHEDEPRQHHPKSGKPHKSSIPDVFNEIYDLKKSAKESSDYENIGLAFTTLVTKSRIPCEVLAKGFKIIEEAAEEADADSLKVLMENIIGPRGVLCKLNYTFSRETSVIVVDFLQTLLTPNDSTKLKIVYDFIYQALITNRNLLKKIVNRPGRCQKLRDVELYTTVILGALKNIVEVKNSLSVIGLHPSLFNLLVVEMPIDEDWFIRYFSSVHLSLLVLIKTHLISRSFFIASSRLISGCSFSESGENNLGIILGKIANVLYSNHLAEDTRRLVFQTLFKLVSDISADQLRQIMDAPVLKRIRKALLRSFLKNGLNFHSDSGHSPDGKHDLALMRKLSVFHMLSGQEVTMPFVERCILQTRDKPLDYAIEVWRTIPASLFVKKSLRSVGVKNLESMQPAALKSNCDDRTFMTVMDLLFDAVVPMAAAEYFQEGDTHWLSYLAHSLFSSISVGGVPATMDSSAKWRSLITQMAAFCVENSMKTPYGKPQETFAKFEGVIRKLAADLQKRDISTVKAYRSRPSKTEKATVVRKKQVEDDDEDFREGGETRERILEPLLLSKAEDLWRVRMILEFIECLDKMINLAHDGSVFQLFEPSPDCQKFFKANYPTCSTCITRMAIPLLSVSFYNGYYAQTIRLGSNVLRDLESRLSSGSTSESIENGAYTVVAWLVRAMVELGDDQSIHGIQRWVNFNLKKEALWIAFAECLARGQVEEAIIGFKSILGDGEKMHQTIQQAVREMLLKALRCVRNAQDWTAWNALASAEENASSRAFQAQCARVKALTEWEPIEERSTSTIEWDLVDKMDDMEYKLLSLSSGSRRPNIRQDMGELMHDLGDEARMLFMLNSFLPLIRASTIHQTLCYLNQKLNTEKNRSKNGMTNISKLNLFHDFDTESVLLEGINETTHTIGDRLGLAQQFATFLMHSIDNVTSDVTYGDFYLNASKLARKTGNMCMAKNHLNSLFEDPASPFRSPLPWPQNAAPIIDGLIPPNPSDEQFTLRNLKVLVHSCKVEYMMDSGKDVPGFMIQFDTHCRAFSYLSKVVSNYVGRRVLENNVTSNGKLYHPDVDLIAESMRGQYYYLLNKDSSKDFALKRHAEIMEMNSVVAKACLTLGSWMEKDPGMYNALYTQFCGTFWYQIVLHHDHIRNCTGLSSTECLAGGLFMMASRIAPIGMCHKKVGDWAALQLAQRDPEFGFPTTLLSPQERSYLSTIVGHDNKLRLSVLSAMAESFTQSDFVSNLQAATKNAPAFFTAALDSQTLLLQMWALSYERRSFLYEMAIRSYFDHLETGDSTAMSIGDMSSALFVLRVMVSHYESLLPYIRDSLRASSSEVWKEILPQLFALLNHSNCEVRDTVLELLQRIAESSPHSVCYQAIVGAYNKDSTLTILKREDGSNAERDGNTISSFASNSCDHLLATISASKPKLTSELNRFVNELQRINLLGEERWVVVLTTLDHEVIRRTRQITKEVSKTCQIEDMTAQEKAQIFAPKWTAVSEPIYKILSDLHKSTCVALGTANEKSFVRHHGETIRIALKQFDKNRGDLPVAWRPFKMLLDNLNLRAAKRSALQLTMEDISTSLYQMRSTAIPLPGQESQPFADVVTIHKMCNRATVLPTKTRPKKIAFIGSDGKEYTFLLKGQEDLHLDERVMQFLNVCNKMLNPKNPTNDKWPAYFNKNYSVTPLGCRSGLIQWVEGGTAIYQMYRKFKNRQVVWKKAQVKEKKKGLIKIERFENDTGANQVKRVVERGLARFSLTENEKPTDIFVRKLKTVMAEQKIPFTTDRSKWPKETLMEVLKRLVADTPRDLLAKEMWLRSGNSETWWRVTQRFARSSAVMSIIGHIIGLGDRHLDNILVNLSTGNVVHIDYNVCFEKGRTLRVPESVPFRLSGNVVHALGPTKIQGTFRESCIHVMETLREEKETLMALLDAFVYDPLVDWSTQDGAVLSAAVNLTTMLAVYGSTHKTVQEKTTSVQQDGNKHAQNVARVIRLKLDGYAATSPSFNEADAEPLAASEQVDTLISEATNPANLAMMYEGWTSWV
ncbi:hypothetical protein L596_008126 [Steinernema carpocapsae]|uniref:non-specific serine/threonine protein kinase n=1 Tax=Steinernema carpocapsae TaxID=34508 RepID=A0A4U5PBL2_STECR|nr:hypothetical protein L596_008126 [Steinernema carpocapsae]